MEDTISLKTILTVSEPTSAAQGGAHCPRRVFNRRVLALSGEHGYGSSWGLLTVGIAVLLVIFALYGYRRKIDILLLSASAVSFMFTTPGWGTLNSQITGVLSGGVYDQNWQQVRVFINPFSGVFIMLCLGFGLCTFFAFSLGRYFSDKPYYPQRPCTPCRCVSPHGYSRANSRFHTLFLTLYSAGGRLVPFRFE